MKTNAAPIALAVSLLLAGGCSRGYRPATASVHGRIVYKGQPLEGVDVNAWIGRELASKTTTGAAGTFRLSGLPSGKEINLVFTKVRNDKWYMNQFADVTLSPGGDVDLGDTEARFAAPPRGYQP